MTTQDAIQKEYDQLHSRVREAENDALDPVMIDLFLGQLGLSMARAEELVVQAQQFTERLVAAMNERDWDKSGRVAGEYYEEAGRLVQ